MPPDMPAAMPPTTERAMLLRGRCRVVLVQPMCAVMGCRIIIARGSLAAKRSFRMRAHIRRAARWNAISW